MGRPHLRGLVFRRLLRPPRHRVAHGPGLRVRSDPEHLCRRIRRPGARRLRTLALVEPRSSAVARHRPALPSRRIVRHLRRTVLERVRAPRDLSQPLCRHSMGVRLDHRLSDDRAEHPAKGSGGVARVRVHGTDRRGHHGRARHGNRAFTCHGRRAVPVHDLSLCGAGVRHRAHRLRLRHSAAARA